MVLEESNVGAAGGNIDIYLRKNLNFDILERYMPKKTTYLININEELIELKDLNNGDILQDKKLLYSATGRTEEHYYLTENNTIYYDIVQNI